MNLQREDIRPVPDTCPYFGCRYGFDSVVVFLLPERGWADFSRDHGFAVGMVGYGL